MPPAAMMGISPRVNRYMLPMHAVLASAPGLPYSSPASFLWSLTMVLGLGQQEWSGLEQGTQLQAPGHME